MLMLFRVFFSSNLSLVRVYFRKYNWIRSINSGNLNLDKVIDLTRLNPAVENDTNVLG